VRANLYGAPTTRTRIFVIGFKPERFTEILTREDFLPDPNTAQINVADALRGLPTRIDCRWVSEESGWKAYEPLDQNQFYDRVNGLIPNGVGDPESVRRFQEKGQVSGCMGTRHSAEVKKRYGALKFGQVDKISKSVRLTPNGFCPTLRAGTGSDKGSYQAVRPIHPTSARVITPREAARLQGFPDWFVFHRTKWHSFRQIGNSVSPIVSEKILSAVINKLI
jgi:DNA (cytosine-5)-methyltransferase 1